MLTETTSRWPAMHIPKGEGGRAADRRHQASRGRPDIDPASATPSWWGVTSTSHRRRTRRSRVPGQAIDRTEWRGSDDGPDAVAASRLRHVQVSDRSMCQSGTGPVLGEGRSKSGQLAAPGRGDSMAPSSTRPAPPPATPGHRSVPMDGMAAIRRRWRPARSGE